MRRDTVYDNILSVYITVCHRTGANVAGCYPYRESIVPKQLQIETGVNDLLSFAIFDFKVKEVRTVVRLDYFYSIIKICRVENCTL